MKWIYVYIKSSVKVFISAINFFFFTTQELFLEHFKTYLGAVQSLRIIITRQAVYLIGVLLIIHL